MTLASFGFARLCATDGALSIALLLPRLSCAQQRLARSRVPARLLALERGKGDSKWLDSWLTG
jgi:hypothetical protein